MPDNNKLEYQKKAVIKLKKNQRFSSKDLEKLILSQTTSLPPEFNSDNTAKMKIEPLFTSLPLQKESNENPRMESMDFSDIDLTLYYTIDVPQEASAQRLAEHLSKLDLVELAYVPGPPAPPPSVNESDDPYSQYQQYLYKSPYGIDAKYAWQYPGGDGLGITLIDLEQGWNLGHEDLADKNIELIYGVNHVYHSHGTSVLGEMAAVDNRLGAVGICPNATVKVVSQWNTPDNFNTANAINIAANSLNRGDILLLEAQTTVNHHTGFLPVEVDDAVFSAIRNATNKGVVVVEAAGNGYNDLDNYRDVNGRYVLNRNSSDFRDSGAIMVGAASASYPHNRLPFSNYGTRIDCYGWGDKITSTSGNLGENEYTFDFGGTSGASPFIAGAAVIAQGLRKAKYGDTYNPYMLRDILKAANLNTPSNSSDKIGYMPNLKAITDFIVS